MHCRENFDDFAWGTSKNWPTKLAWVNPALFDLNSIVYKILSLGVFGSFQNKRTSKSDVKRMKMTTEQDHQKVDLSCFIYE